MLLSDALRTMRQKSFMTQESFAQEMGVTASTINRWENAKAKPNLTAMKKLKSFCEKNDLDYLVIETAWFAAHVQE